MRILRVRNPLRVVAAIALGCLAAAVSLLAWGDKPHADITDAALSVIPPDDLLRLGGEAYRVRMYVHLADWVESLVEIHERWEIGGVTFPSPAASFYTNDYLNFPASPRPNDHGVPGVLNTYRPFFARALQALRTESPTNAARWIGTLLHYVTDTGSPPHAAGIKGELHTKMENWLDASRIDMNGYRPQLLGASDAEALDGLARRMDGLIAFSKLRAERLRPLAETNNRPACEPIAMESATETAKVTADVIHTLLHLTARPPGGGELVAEVTAPPFPLSQTMPVKLVLLSTNFSTLSDLAETRGNGYQGLLHFRNLPPGTYRPVISRPGAKTIQAAPFTVKSGDRLHLRWDLAPDATPGNLLRNADFSIRWIDAASPDYWHFDKAKNAWISDNIKAAAGASYRAGLARRSGPARTVAVQWMAEHWLAAGDPVEIRESGSTLTAPPKTHFVRLLVSGREDPASGIASIYLTTDSRGDITAPGQ